MRASKLSRQFATALREVGERVQIVIDGVTYERRAVVQNAGKNFMRKYDDDQNARGLTGRALVRDKIAFIPFFKALEETPYDVEVYYRDKCFVVVADSTMNIGDHPVYIWALLREKSQLKEEYYEDIAD